MRRPDRRTRRALLATALALPVAAAAGRAGAAGPLPRIAQAHPLLSPAALKEGRLTDALAERGLREDRDVAIERFSAAGSGRLAELAGAVVASRPDLVIAWSTRLVLALKALTTTIPIVGITDDPVAAGIVADLARPGGNITGFSTEPGPEIRNKRLALLKEVRPAATRIGYLASEAFWRRGVLAGLREAAVATGATIVGAPLGLPPDEAHCRRALEAMRAAGAQACLVSDQNELSYRAPLTVIARLTTALRLPTLSPHLVFTELGGLMSYGTPSDDVATAVAELVARILQGASPAALPFRLPTRFVLGVNLRSAAALDLALPPSLLARADQVID